MNSVDKVDIEKIQWYLDKVLNNHIEIIKKVMVHKIMVLKNKHPNQPQQNNNNNLKQHKMKYIEKLKI